MRLSSYIRKPFFIYAPVHSEFPYILGKFDILFLSVNDIFVNRDSVGLKPDILAEIYTILCPSRSDLPRRYAFPAAFSQT